MLWGITGHDWAVQILRHHIANAETRHAYLFTGARGVGRRSLALRFAQALNCPSPTAPGEPCMTCLTCKQIERQQHADLAIIASETEGGTLKVEQVRELQHSLSLAPYAAPYRIALLLRFHEANPSAQNALLKTLEEAPPRAILLATADSVESLLPTIVSRCEVLRLRPMALDTLAAELEQRGSPPAQARLLAHLASGRLGYALQLKDNPEAVKRRQEIAEDLLHLFSANRYDRFKHAEKLAKEEKTTLREVLQAWLTLARDLMLVASGEPVGLVHIDLLEPLQRLCASLTLAQACQLAASLQQALTRLDANVNTRLALEVLLLDLPFVSNL